MKSILLSWDDITNGKAIKAIKSTFMRGGTPVALVESDNKAKRSSGISYKTIILTFSDGQKVSLDAKQDGDIFAVKVNGSLTPLKNLDDHYKAIAEIIAKLDSGRAKFQAAQARVKVELPKGLKSTVKKDLEILTERNSQLDVALADATAKRDALKSELALDSVAMDSCKDKETAMDNCSIDKVDIMDGEYNGIMSGYSVVIPVGINTDKLTAPVEFKTKSGIRGSNFPVGVIVKNGIAEIVKSTMYDSANWSAEVDTKWHPEEGFFTK